MPSTPPPKESPCDLMVIFTIGLYGARGLLDDSCRSYSSWPTRFGMGPVINPTGDLCNGQWWHSFVRCKIRNSFNFPAPAANFLSCAIAAPFLFRRLRSSLSAHAGRRSSYGVFPSSQLFLLGGCCRPRHLHSVLPGWTFLFCCGAILGWLSTIQVLQWRA